MRKTHAHGVGGVLSADIAVPDHEREVRFYSKVLTTGDAPLWREDLMNNQGTPVIGLGIRTPEYDCLPLQWMPHFQVADVLASAVTATKLGGQKLLGSTVNDPHGEWAVIMDPFGAAFGLIPAVDAESDPASQNDRVGCISWLSLTVPDAAAGQDFYHQVVGWNAKAADGTEQCADFEMQREGQFATAEILQDSNEADAIPPVWLIHIPVDDLDESLRRVDEYGGEIVQAFPDADGAVIRDPVGVYFVLKAGPL